MKNLHVKLRVWRKKNNLSQIQLAEMIGAGHRSVCRWESEGIPKTNKPLQNVLIALIKGTLND